MNGLQQRLVSLDDQAMWEAQLNNIAHGPAHTWVYNQAIQLSSQRPTFLYCAEADNFKAICALAVREKMGKQDVVTPYGYGGLVVVGDNAHFLQASQEYLADAGYICGYLQLHPFFCEERYFVDIPIANEIYLLDLTKTLDELNKQLAKVHRYELRQWQKTDVEIVYDVSRLKPALLDLYRQTLDRVHAASVYHFSAATLMALMESANVLAVGAEVNGEIEAVCIFLYTPYAADYFLNACSMTGRQHARGLLWHAIQQLKILNVPLLNLGGGIKPGDQLEDFKRRFGGIAKGSKSLKQIYNQSVFDDICLQVGDAASTHYFPPYYLEKKKETENELG